MSYFLGLNAGQSTQSSLDLETCNSSVDCSRKSYFELDPNSIVSSSIFMRIHKKLETTFNVVV